MASLLNTLRTQYGKKYDLKLYTDPKIYHGGSDYDTSKLWYVYYSFRHPDKKTKSGIPKLVRQPPIYDNLNAQYKSKKSRLKAFNQLRDSLQHLLDQGYSPYQLTNEDKYSIENSIDYGVILIKESNPAKSTIDDYNYRVGIFKKFLNERGLLHEDVKSINQTLVNDFLESEKSRTSAANANNSRAALSAIFTAIKKKGYVGINYFYNAAKFPSEPKIHKAFTPSQVSEILEYSYEDHRNLWIYFAMVYYGLFRPVTVIRLKVENVDIERRMLFSKTKTFEFYKQIPKVILEKYFNDIDLRDFNKSDWLITKNGVPSSWPSSETSRRDWFSKQFSNKIKPQFQLSNDYTIYSFRHTAIGQIFLKKIDQFKDDSNTVEKALSAVREITGHISNEAVKKYLRKIGYFQIKDWSDLL